MLALHLSCALSSALESQLSRHTSRIEAEVHFLVPRLTAVPAVNPCTPSKDQRVDVFTLLPEGRYSVFDRGSRRRAGLDMRRNEAPFQD